MIIRRRFFFSGLLVLTVLIATLYVLTGHASMRTYTVPSVVKIPITATTTISNVVIDLSDPLNPEILGEIEATITLRDPGTNQPIRDQVIRIAGVDLSHFANNTASASTFFTIAALAAKTALESHDIYISDSIIENVKLVKDAETEELIGTTIQVNVKAEIKAEGINDPMATAIVGEQVPDGEVIWETRIRMTLDGNNYTALDPKDTTIKSYIKNILQNVRMVLPK